jgi:hypothetical protein
MQRVCVSFCTDRAPVGTLSDPAHYAQVPDRSERLAHIDLQRAQDGLAGGGHSYSWAVPDNDSISFKYRSFCTRIVGQLINSLVKKQKLLSLESPT